MKKLVTACTLILFSASCTKEKSVPTPIVETGTTVELNNGKVNGFSYLEEWKLDSSYYSINGSGNRYEDRFIKYSEGEISDWDSYSKEWDYELNAEDVGGNRLLINGLTYQEITDIGANHMVIKWTQQPYYSIHYYTR